MKGLWILISYFETYLTDCNLVRRCHLNLSLIIEIFQNIINSFVKEKQKLVFNQQRMSMLPHSAVGCLDSNNHSFYSMDHLALKKPQQTSLEGGNLSHANQQINDQFYVAPSENTISENGLHRNKNSEEDDRLELDRLFK